MLTETIPVLETHRFDEEALRRYMAERVPGFRGSLAIRQFLGGQSNPTYHVVADGQEYILRRKPPGKLLPSAHAVDREYRVITALVGTDVPVPRTYALCEDPSVIGTPFFIMECVHGRVFADPMLPELPPAERVAIYEDMVDVLARLHRLDWQAVGLADFGRPGNYYARQIHRWSQQYRASETETIEAMESLIEWLPAHIPPDDETTLVHGDYRLGNAIVHPTEPRILAVLDWELSTLGHPLADLAYSSVTSRWGPEGLYSFKDRNAVPAGIPTEEEYVAAYCRRTGRAGISDWHFYIAFALFRLAAIAQGIMGRVRDGTANDPAAAERGRRARPLADEAWAVVQSDGG
ncbi:MAG: phosphotransferase family protein [Candidatus Rokubacteria bacterium]|nr:phosphotransferase family protein [Candidatus Rokubacteria bacterium]